jgi:hypothetical protein
MGDRVTVQECSVWTVEYYATVESRSDKFHVDIPTSCERVLVAHTVCAWLVFCSFFYAVNLLIYE